MAGADPEQSRGDAAPWEVPPSRTPQQPASPHVPSSYSPPPAAKRSIPRWAWIVVPFVLFMVIGGATLQILKGSAEADREKAVKEAEQQKQVQHAEAEKLLAAARSYILDAYANAKMNKKKALDAFNKECLNNRFATEHYTIRQALPRGADGSGYDVEVTASPNAQAVDRQRCILVFSLGDEKQQISWQ
ncbi:MAG: hypothetical protein KDB90_08410 [Planctomycetes bacterium]|nr:hypothetical protein [Planctomycetota bacterium]